jgi:mono/diheme cytochrome c family protein
MIRKEQRFPIHLFLPFLLLLGACRPPSGLPEGPTPIPTLIPVTEVSALAAPEETPSYTIRSYPAQPPSAADGQQIYIEFCAQCHGEDGMGLVPAARNFGDLDYMRGETPADFYAVVTEGRNEMPGYRERLSSDQIWEVVFFVWRLSTDAETLQVGSQIYTEDCASCHGEVGSGELLGSADFTDLRQMDNLAPRDLYLTVTQGRGSMPAWQSLLTQDERWAVIDYIRTFTYNPELPGQSVSPTPTAEGTLPTEGACAVEDSNPLAWDSQAAIQSGEVTYQDQCSACHGTEGKGSLPNTPDFTSAEVQADLRGNPGRYRCAIADGVGTMPSFGESLSADEQWQVITYLNSLGP